MLYTRYFEKKRRKRVHTPLVTYMVYAIKDSQRFCGEPQLLLVPRLMPHSPALHNSFESTLFDPPNHLCNGQDNWSSDDTAVCDNTSGRRIRSQVDIGDARNTLRNLTGTICVWGEDVSTNGSWLRESAVSCIC